jgi:hypothetical protein
VCFVIDSPFKEQEYSSDFFETVCFINVPSTSLAKELARPLASTHALYSKALMHYHYEKSPILESPDVFSQLLSLIKE